MNLKPLEFKNPDGYSTWYGTSPGGLRYSFWNSPSGFYWRRDAPNPMSAGLRCGYDMDSAVNACEADRLALINSELSD